MADESTPTANSGLLRFDLPLVFLCAVELAEAVVQFVPSEWASIPISGPDSPHFEKSWERHVRLKRIEDESERLKRSLGATGPLVFTEIENDLKPKWESYDKQFNNSIHDRVVRLALNKIATAAIDLAGFATWREWQWPMRETGLRLLTLGLAQLWDGMAANERAAVQDLLSRAHNAVGWPCDNMTDPPTYSGPDEIPLPYQYRLVSNFVSCYSSYFDDMQQEERFRIQDDQREFLQRATVEQFAQVAERTRCALARIAHPEFDAAIELALYSRASWELACLRRANEIPPLEPWPDSMNVHRIDIANSSDVLLSVISQFKEVKEKLKPAQINAALATFNHSVEQMRDPDRCKHISQDSANATGIGFLGGEALADKLGVHPSRRGAFLKQIGRDRKRLGDENWQQVFNPRANSPRFQYRADSPTLRELAERYKSPKP